MRRIHHVTWSELAQGIAWTVFVFALIFLAAFAQKCKAQNVTRQGKLFIQNPSNSPIKKDSVTLTGYLYVDAKGVRYPIYMSSKGKCFILRTSSKTSKQYKQYLPEITKQLSKYENR